MKKYMAVLIAVLALLIPLGIMGRLGPAMQKVSSEDEDSEPCSVIPSER